MKNIKNIPSHLHCLSSYLSIWTAFVLVVGLFFMNNEIWKPIPEFEGLYEASNLGRIKSIERIVNHPACGRVSLKDRILKPVVSKKGYHSVFLYKNGINKRMTVHRLIMYAFIGVSSQQIDHINEVKNDNRLCNLRYCSNRENNHAYTQKRRSNMMSKFMGVTYSKNESKWKAQITIGKKHIHLGTFDFEHDAHLAYQKALHELCV